MQEGWALNETGGPRTVRVATAEDLLAIAEHSPCSEDALCKAGPRAVLASTHSAPGGERGGRPPEPVRG